LLDQQPLKTVDLDGISVALAWAYADTTRIGIEFRITEFTIPDGYQIFCPVASDTLKDNSGRDYGKYLWGGWGGNDPWLDKMTFDCHQEGKDYVITQNYYNVQPSAQQTLDLTSTVTLGGFDSFNNNDGTKSSVPEVGPFTFNFSIPVGGSLTIDPHQSASKNEVTVTLDRLAINPTFTDVFYSISYNNHGGWNPDLKITWQGNSYAPLNDIKWRTEAYDPNGMTTSREDGFKTERWFRQSIKLPYTTSPDGASPQSMAIVLSQITINAMDNPTQEDCAQALKAAQQVNPGIDFTCNIENSPNGLSFGITVNKIPDGMTEQDVSKLANDGFRRVVEGPWSLSVNIPSR